MHWGEHDEEIIEAVTSRKGFSLALDPPAVGAQPVTTPDVLTLNSTRVRHWMLSLNSWRYSSGNLPTSPQVAGQPLDNQVSTSVDLKVLLEWGADGATEKAVIDYPCRGCTMQFPASIVRMSLRYGTAGTQAVPMVSGFLSPTGPRAQAVANWPTFTTQPDNISPGVTERIPVPARAISYIVYQAEPFITGYQIRAIQTNQTGNQQTKGDGDTANFLGIPGEERPIVLAPRTQFINLENPGVVLATQVVVQFNLDLG